MNLKKLKKKSTCFNLLELKFGVIFFEYYNAVIHQKKTNRIRVGISKIARTETEYEIKKSFLFCNKRLISLPLFFPSIFGNISKQI